MYSFKVNEKEKKSPAKVGAYGDASPDTKDYSSPLGEVGDAVITEVKADHCSPEAPSSPSSWRGLFQFTQRFPKGCTFL